MLSIQAAGLNNYKGANTTYSFKINLVNYLGTQGRIYVNFTSDWNLYNPNCTINSGITPLPDGSMIFMKKINKI